MALGIGYNIKKVEELMGEMATAYKDYGSFINQQWAQVQNTLRTNWIGEDELDYEKRLVERLCNLYANSYELAKTSIDVLADLAKAWYDFQKNNSITGEAIANVGNFSITKPTITKNEKIIEFVTKTIGPEEDRGLKDASSATTIQESLSSFVKGLKMMASQKFNLSNSSNAAFFGEQASAITKYVNKVGIAIGEVNIAINDMYTAIATLAGSQYTTSSSTAADAAAGFSTQLDGSLAEMDKGTRWTQE